MKKLLVVFLVLLGVAVVSASLGIVLSQGGDGPFSSRPTVLVWKLDGPLLEQAPATSFPFGRAERSSSMARLYQAFRSARRDAAVRGIAVYVQSPSCGLAKAQELRHQLAQLHDAGKFVECYLETVGEGSNGTLAYYLATACDHILLAPAGSVNLLGLYVDTTFFRGSLDKLKIIPEFRHVGRYKSAAETFTRSDRSEPSAEAMSRVLDSLYEQVVAGIGKARGLSADDVRRLVDGAPYDSHEALDAGLVDQLAYPEEFHTRLEELAGTTPRLVRLETYGRAATGRGRKIAILFAPGTIVRGQGGFEPWTEEQLIGSGDIGALLRGLREDDSVAAVVLRVDSPGGSALASDLILHQVELLREAKPVVVSMSDLAASGGYYISAGATRIVAEPASLTGSIGVLSGKFATRRFQKELLGVTHDPLQRGANADLYSSLDPYTPAQAERVQQLMKRTYDTFVEHVAKGRRMSSGDVEEVAAGRVWTGADAKDLGLVDELGGLDEALALARRLAGIGSHEPVHLIFLPEPPSLFDYLVESSRPALPTSLVRLARWADTRPLGLLELPPQLARLAAPFGESTY